MTMSRLRLFRRKSAEPSMTFVVKIEGGAASAPSQFFLEFVRSRPTFASIRPETIEVFQSESRRVAGPEDVHALVQVLPSSSHDRSRRGLESPA